MLTETEPLTPQTRVTAPLTKPKVLVDLELRIAAAMAKQTEFDNFAMHREYYLFKGFGRGEPVKVDLSKAKRVMVESGATMCFHYQNIDEKYRDSDAYYSNIIRCDHPVFDIRNLA